MAKLRVEFQFPDNGEDLQRLKSLAEHPENVNKRMLDEGRVAVLIDGKVVAPPWSRPVYDGTFTGFDFVGGTVLELRGAARRLQEGTHSESVNFLDSPISIELHREDHVVAVTITADVGPEFTPTTIGETRVQLEELLQAGDDAALRYNDRLREIDPRLPAIYGIDAASNRRVGRPKV